MPLNHVFLQDSLKIEEVIKETEDSKILIPELEEEIPKLQQLLLNEEKILEDIKDQSKGGPFSCYQ